MAINLTIETEKEDDGRWIVEIPALPGVMAYGPSREEAVAQVQALALRVLAEGIDAERLELGTSDEFWKLISERRGEAKIDRHELEERIEGLQSE